MSSSLTSPIASSQSPQTAPVNAVEQQAGEQLNQQSNIEAEEDIESAYAGSSIESETQSLVGSLHEYFEQHGRRYHTYYGLERNPMPNDATEQERLDITHEALLTITNRRLHLSPLGAETQVHRVLDLGTGTGIWALDFAYENPQAEVIGIDLSPIQPTLTAPNCRFQVDDFELEWNFTHKFDFIYARCITQSVTDWPRLLQQAKEQLNPGGWFEASDFVFMAKCDDGTMPDDWPPKVMFELIPRALEQTGRVVVDSAATKAFMEQEGFVDVQVKTFKCPNGVWPKNPIMKQAGMLALASIQSGYEAYGLALLTRVLGMPEEEVIEMCTKAREAHLNRRVHSYWEYYVVYGRKPLESEKKE